MPFNGTGVFQRIYSWAVDQANNVDVRADRMDTDSNDIASGLSMCITKDGQQSITADIPWNGWRITGLGNGSSGNDAVNYAQVFVNPALTVPTAVASPSQGDNSLKLTTTAWVQAYYAPLASPALTGTPTAPTAAVGASTTQIATTAFVAATAFSAALPAQTGNAGKYIATNGSSASWSNITALGGLVTNGIVTTTGGVGTVSTATVTATNGQSLTFSANTLMAGLAAGFSPTMIAQAASLTLPSLVTLGATPLIVAPTNAATVPANLTTSDNWTVATGFSAGALAALSPTHILSAHGAWGSKAMLPPQLGSTITTGASLTLQASVQLDTNLYVIVYNDASNFYASAIDTLGNTVGSKVTLGAFGAVTLGSVWKVSTTSFVAFVETSTGAGGTWTAIAGSVSGTTITLGSGITFGNVAARPIQCSGSLYALLVSNASDLNTFSVSGTTVTTGTATASGAVTTGGGGSLLTPISATTFLVAYLSTGGGSSTTRAMSARVASVSAGVITLNTAATGSSIEKDANLRLLRAFGAGGPWVAVVQNGATATTGDFYGISTSGTTTTLGTVVQRTNDLPSASLGAPTLTYQTIEPVWAYNSTTMLFGHLAAGPYVMTISGTALTGGAATALSGASTKIFLLDLNTATNFYAVGGGLYDKISVSGTTITSTDSFTGGAPTVIYSDTLNDKAAKYSGTWYAWTMSVLGGLSTAQLIFRNGTNDLSINGPLS